MGCGFHAFLKFLVDSGQKKKFSKRGIISMALNSFAVMISQTQKQRFFLALTYSFLFSPDFEASFIRLLDKVTNGSKIEINQTGK